MQSVPPVRAALLIFDLLATGAASRSTAQDARASDGAAALSTVHVLLPPCATPPFDADLFMSVLRVELAADGVTEIEFSRAAVVDLKTGPSAHLSPDAATCRADADAVAVTIDDPSTGGGLRRVIELGDISLPTRARALALAVAELLRGSWAEQLNSARSAHQPMTPVAAIGAITLEITTLEPPAPSPAVPPARFSGGAEVEYRMFPSYNSALLGGRMTSSIRLGSGRLRAHVDAGALVGSAFDPLGNVDLGLGSAGIGLGVAGGSDDVAVETGPRVEAGAGWASGRPSGLATGARGTQLVVTASATATVRLRCSQRWWATVALEAGWVMRGFEARSADRTTAGLAGPMAGIALGAVLAK